jgi:uncharacterized protein (TIGR01777 family)
MRIGVTGASGFIGSALVGALEQRGDQVVRFVRSTGSAATGDVVRWDPARQTIDDDDLRRVGDFDAVVHLAGAGIADKRWTAARKGEILRSRTESTNLLVEALGSSGTAFLASGSAIGFYGSRGDEVLDETSSQGDDFLADVCGRWEEATTPLTRQGTGVALLRTGIVMSQNGGALKKQLPLFRLGLGGPLSSGRQWLSPISLVDEVRAILWVIEKKIIGPVNLTGPQPLRNDEFTKVLAQEIHRPALLRVPAFALKIALGAELANGAVLASQRVIPKVLTESGFSFENPTNTEIVTSSLRA